MTTPSGNDVEAVARAWNAEAKLWSVFGGETYGKVCREGLSVDDHFTTYRYESLAEAHDAFQRLRDAACAQSAIAALNIPALEQKLADMTDDYFRVHKDSVDRMEKIIALEAANAAQSVRIATLLEDNHCIPELEARIKELESDAVQWQQSRDWFALKCITLKEKLKQFNVEDEEIMEVTRRAASALGDQHE